ncbi:hypothetical protein N8072_00640 [bacterium]|nr:hypothetical protein [bacterium]MDB4128458.1 hypothetical protein [bacterium]MDC1257169.1 hypothetical protein [bacterium]
MRILSKLKVYLIMFAAFAAFAGVAYWYYQDSQAALKQYAENQAKLELALTTQAQAMESLKSDLALMQEVQQNLITAFSNSRELTKSLETLFNEDSDGNPRDFSVLSAEQPELVTKELNRGTHEVFECFENLSGNERNGTDQEYIDCFDNSN